MADSNIPHQGPQPNLSERGWQAREGGARREGHPTSLGESLRGVRWFRQLSVRVRRGGVTIHVDPNGVPSNEPPADFILLTHPHYDVFSERDIEQIRHPETVVIAPASMKKLVSDGDHYLTPGDGIQVGGVDIVAVPAYNLARRYHPKEAGWLGYLFSIDGVTYYHAGHTGLIPSMSRLQCDVAFLPCDGKYSMGAAEMVRAAEACHARVVVPIHCGGIPGGKGELERIRKTFPGEVALLEPATPISPRH